MARINKYTFLLLLLSFQETVIIYFFKSLTTKQPFAKSIHYQIIVTYHVSCRSQKTAVFQKQSELNALLSGLSLTGLAAGPVIGFSQSPRAILKYKGDLALGHQSYVCEQIAKAIEVHVATVVSIVYDCVI